MYENKPSSQSSGLWARSVGDYYPYIVYGHQADADSLVRYGVMGPDFEARVFGTCEYAIREAKRLKCRHELRKGSLPLGEARALLRRDLSEDLLREARREATEAADPKAYGAANIALLARGYGDFDKGVAAYAKDLESLA